MAMSGPLVNKKDISQPHVLWANVPWLAVFTNTESKSFFPLVHRSCRKTSLKHCVLVFSRLLVQARLNSITMAHLWGKKGCRSADVVPSRQPMAFRGLCLASWRASSLSLFSQSGFQVRSQCIPHVFAFCRLWAGLVLGLAQEFFYFDRQDVMFCSPCYQML